MSARMLIGSVLFCFFMTGMFLANMFLFMMVGDVNSKRPDGNQISYFGHHYFKRFSKSIASYIRRALFTFTC